MNRIEQTKTAEQMVALQLMQTVLKKSLGDGMEFEICYQAMLDSMNTGDSTMSNILNSFSGTSGTSAINSEKADELYKMLANGLNYNSKTNRVTDTLSSKDEMTKIYETVSKYSKKYGVDEKLVLAVIKAESNFDVNAVSEAGATGLMQVMPSNFSAYGVTDGKDIEQNVQAGVRILKDCLNRFNGNVQMALMAYNAGAGTMQNRGVTSAGDLYKMPKETQNYVPKVIGYYNSL